MGVVVAFYFGATAYERVRLRAAEDADLSSEQPPVPAERAPSGTVQEYPEATGNAASELLSHRLEAFRRVVRIVGREAGADASGRFAALRLGACPSHRPRARRRPPGVSGRRFPRRSTLVPNRIRAAGRTRFTTEVDL